MVKIDPSDASSLRALLRFPLQHLFQKLVYGKLKMKFHGQKNTSMQRNWQQGKEQIWQKVLLVYNLHIIVYDMISKNEENRSTFSSVAWKFDVS